MPPRKTHDPPTDNEWDRRSLEGADPESGTVRHRSRLLAAAAPTLLAMAASREKWAVLRVFIRRALITMGIVMGSIMTLKDQILDLLAFLRGTP